MIQTRKTIIIIVEGASEQVALELSLSEFFQSNYIRFHIVHGDITTGKNISAANIINKINSLIESERKIYGLKRKDIVAIIHLVDTDGAFIDDCKIIESNTDSTIYENNCIKTDSAEKIMRRNRDKRSVLFRLIRCYEINKTPYRIFYMSCNLDHVIGNNQNATNDEKETYSSDFRAKYSDDLSGFLDFFKSVLPDVSTYKESWEFIQKENNSLKRYSNMSFLFEESFGENNANTTK